MHKVSRVVTKDISLVDVRLDRLHSCLQSWISIRMYCDAHRKRHVLPLCQTMQVVRRHPSAAFRCWDENDVRISSVDASSKASAHQHACVPNRSAQSDLKNQVIWHAPEFVHRHRSLHSLSLRGSAVPERDLRVDEEQEATFSVFLEGFADKSADAQHSWDMYWKASQPSASSAWPSSILTPASSSLTWTSSTLTFTLPSSRRVGCPFQAER